MRKENTNSFPFSLLGKIHIRCYQTKQEVGCFPYFPPRLVLPWLLVRCLGLEHRVQMAREGYTGWRILQTWISAPLLASSYLFHPFVSWILGYECWESVEISLLLISAPKVLQLNPNSRLEKLVQNKLKEYELSAKWPQVSQSKQRN